MAKEKPEDEKTEPTKPKEDDIPWMGAINKLTTTLTDMGSRLAALEKVKEKETPAIQIPVPPKPEPKEEDNEEPENKETHQEEPKKKSLWEMLW